MAIQETQLTSLIMQSIVTQSDGVKVEYLVSHQIETAGGFKPTHYGPLLAEEQAKEQFPGYFPKTSDSKR